MLKIGEYEVFIGYKYKILLIMYVTNRIIFSL